MEKYIINNVEYTFEEISSAANENGVDIDTYINGMGGQVVNDAVEEPVEKPKAVAEETAPAAAETVNTDLQLANGSLEPVNYKEYNQKDVDSLKARFDQGNFKTNQSEAYLNYKQTGNLDTSLLPEKYSRPVNPETNKPFTAMEWVKNSLYNDDVMMEAASDFRSGEGAIDVMSASILSKLYGKENAEKMVAEDAKDGETFWTDGMSEEELTKGIKRVEELNNKRKQTASIVEGFKEGDLGQTAAGVFNAATQVYSSLKYAAGTAFTGWFTDFYAQNYINVNKAEAERKGVDFEEYITSGEDNVVTPFATAYVQTALESFSAKKIVGKDVINKATKKVTEKLVGKEAAEKALKANSAKQAKETVLGTARAEAGTEIGQSAAEIYSETLAKTDDISEALAASIDFVFSEEGAEVALQGAFGGGIAKFTGKQGKRALKAMRETRVAIDDNKTEQLVDELAELNKQLVGATDTDVKQGLESQIKEKSAELDGLVTRANGIVDGMTNDEIDEINSMSDLAQAQIQRVNALNAKKKAGDINNDEYLSALEGYKTEFVKAKNRIKGIVEEAADVNPEKVAQRTVKNADAINQAYTKDQSQETFFNTVLPNMDDLVTGIVNRKFRENPEFGEQGITKQDFKNDLIYGTERNQASSLIGLYNSFRPEEGQLLTTYITNNLENRSKRIVDERLGKQVTTGGVSIDTQESKELEADDIVIPETKGPKFVKRLNLSNELMNKARKAAVKALSTAGKVDSRTFTTDVVNSINNEIFEDIRNLVPKPKEREAFMEQFAGAVWDAIPQSSLAKATRNQTFQEWNLEAPTKEAFVDYFLGRDQEGLKASTINDRVKKQLPQYLAKAIGAEYASDLLQNDTEVRERFSLTQKQEVEDAAKKIVENDDSSWFDYKKFQESTEVSEDDAAAQTKDWNKQLPNGEETLVIQGKEAKHEKAKEEFRNWVKTVMSKYFPKEFFFIAGSGHLTNSSSRMAFANKESVASELESSKFAEDSSGINWNLVGRIDYKGLGQQAKIYTRGLFKGKNKAEVTLADLKKNWKSIQAQGTENMKALKFATKQFAKMYADDKSTAKFIATWYKSATNNQNHILRFAAPLKAFSKDLSSGMREEHTMPASLVGKYLFNSILNNDVDNAFKNVEKNYFQVALAIADDNKLKGPGFNYASGMPKGWKFTDNTWARYFNNFVNDNNGGIDPNGIEFFETGKTVAETFEAEATNQTPDVTTAQQKVIQEKTEDSVETLIDRAIGKLEDYLGPKGALQANFGSVPINILIGGLRATKLAYRGSKNLAKALEAGYKKVQDYMSQQEWLDFAKQAVTEVKKEKTGAGVALAIANESAIKNEQNRQNKLEVLKKAKVYSKEDDSKTSKELDEKLAEEDKKIKDANRTEGMERNFRRILNQQKSTGKRPSKWFIPSNAEDVKGLLYAFLPDGNAGVAAKKFFNSAILKPYSDAIAAAEAEILQLSKKFVELKEKVKVNFDENIEGTPYTMSDAIKVYNWTKAGVEVDVLKQEYLDRMIGAVEANAEAKYLAEEIAAGYDIEYNKNWRGVPLNKSIYDAINKGTRTKHLETFSQNVDAIFNKDNLQEIENVFGKSYVQALQNSLKRMQSGRNRVSTDAQSNKFLNWINKSVATTMFFNTRSAALQLLSSLNFIGQKDNNLFQATAAFANQEQWQQDYNTLWNSDYLSNRREGAKFDVLADEIAEDQESFLNKLLQKGFLPTRYADSFAIALGGAAFYRNRANALMKDGMSKEDAEAQALKDWQASAEETQQSSDPSKISEIQASSIGKIIYAFANTPFQYARKSKRLLQDVASGRSKAEGGMNQVRKDLQSVFYYTVGQAMLFNALQSALFASMFSDDEEDKLEEKTITSIERALTSYAKSLGNPGAVVGSVYSVLAEANEQIEKRGRIDNAYKLALEATAISPPLNTKLKDIVAIGNIYKYNHKQIEKDPFEVKLDNPVLEIAGNAASFAGYPLDRVIRKAQNLEAVMNEETAAWEKVFLTLGWSKWELGVDTGSKKKKKGKFKKAFDKKEFDSAFNRLERGVAGVANNDGTIEVDPDLSPVEREKTIAHEKKHVEDMKAGKLNYDDNYVYWNGKKYERKNGKIKYNGKWYEEGHKSLPWEKAAYDAEPTTQEIKKRKKLY